MSDSAKRLKTLKYRLYPSKRQTRNLFNTLACARNFYNMCLAERKWSYELEGRSVSRNEQLRNRFTVMCCKWRPPTATRRFRRSSGA
jgi:transposase